MHQEKRKKTQKQQNAPKVTRAEIAYNHSEEESILSDVLGSYTGVPYDGERPEQDADDL